jgi:hypothetical protein
MFLRRLNFLLCLLCFVVSQVQPVLEAKKLWTSTLQSSVDRAKSEQYLLLVGVTHADMRLKQWQTLAGQLNPMISNFADRLSAHCDSSVQQIQDKSESLLSLSSSLSLAEGVRMALPHSNASLTSPLDALCRGYFGEEIADLINRLRVSSRDISQLSGSVHSVQKQMMVDIAAEIATLVQCGDSLTELASL